MKGAWRARGFTLLEMLVVLVVVGVVLGMVQLTSGAGPATLAREQGQAILQTLHAARQSALLESREHGLRLSRTASQPMRREAGEWRPLDEPRLLPAGWQWRLQSGGQDVALGERLEGPAQIRLFSSDELTPFVLQLEDGQRQWLTISSDGLAEPSLDER